MNQRMTSFASQACTRRHLTYTCTVQKLRYSMYMYVHSPVHTTVHGAFGAHTRHMQCSCTCSGVFTSLLEATTYSCVARSFAVYVGICTRKLKRHSTRKCCSIQLQIRPSLPRPRLDSGTDQFLVRKVAMGLERILRW